MAKLQQGISTFYSCNKPKAIEILSNFLQSPQASQNSERYRGLLFRAQSHAVLQDLPKCMDDLLEAESIGTDYQKPLASALRKIFVEKNNDSGLAELQNATTVFPKSGDIWHWYGHFLPNTSASAKRNALKQAISLNYSESSESHFDLGNMHYDERDFDAAIREYTTSLHLNPNRTICHIQLGKAYVATSQWSEAKKSFTQAYNLNPNIPDIYGGFVQVYMYEKNKEMMMKAVDCFRESKNAYGIGRCIVIIL